MAFSIDYKERLVATREISRDDITKTGEARKWRNKFVAFPENQIVVDSTAQKSFGRMIKYTKIVPAGKKNSVFQGRTVDALKLVAFFLHNMWTRQSDRVKRRLAPAHYEFKKSGSDMAKNQKQSD